MLLLPRRVVLVRAFPVPVGAANVPLRADKLIRLAIRQVADIAQLRSAKGTQTAHFVGITMDLAMTTLLVALMLTLVLNVRPLPRPKLALILAVVGQIDLVVVEAVLLQKDNKLEVVPIQVLVARQQDVFQTLLASPHLHAFPLQSTAEPLTLVA